MFLVTTILLYLVFIDYLLEVYVASKVVPNIYITINILYLSLSHIVIRFENDYNLVKLSIPNICI